MTIQTVLLKCSLGLTYIAVGAPWNFFPQTSSSRKSIRPSSLSMQLGGSGGGFVSSRGRQDGLLSTGSTEDITASPNRNSGFVMPNQNNFQSPITTSSYSRGTNPGELALDISVDAPRNIYLFNGWQSECGVQKAQGLNLAEDENLRGEVYAATSTDMPTGTPVLYVPESLILSSSKAMDELRTRSMSEAEQAMIASGSESELPQYYLMLKILTEIQNGRDSAWYHWLNSLPRYFSNAASMTDYCLLCLPPLMRKLAEEERDNMNKLCSSDTLDKVPFLTESMKSHVDCARWAYQIVYTRSIPVNAGTEYKIVPVADYFNHGSDYTEITSNFDENGNYYAYTSYDVMGGSPLRISYIDGVNPSHLLARYGFLDEDCPATYCKLLPPAVNQDMLDLGYSYERMLFYRSGEVADEVSCSC